MIRQKVGEILGLSLQAFDGASGIYPQAILRDSGGGLLDTKDLTHIADGLYTDRTFFMPDNALVTAQYKVYLDASHTELDLNYQDSIDVFVKDVEDGSTRIVDGTLIGIVDDSDELVGEVDEIQTQPLIGLVESDSIVGVVDEDDLLVGEIADDTLIGIISEED